MTGNLDMGAIKITSTAFPTTILDLTNKNYVDPMITGYTTTLVANYGDIITCTLNMGSYKITKSSYTVSPFDMTNKSWVDVAANNFLAVAGTSTDALY
ncbi:hypothetical protein CHS0354_017740, partial [Potamilus streckersoni]